MQRMRPVLPFHRGRLPAHRRQHGMKHAAGFGRRLVSLLRGCGIVDYNAKQSICQTSRSKIDAGWFGSPARPFQNVYAYHSLSVCANPTDRNIRWLCVLKA